MRSLYMYGPMYVILYFDPRVFVLVRLSTPSQIALNRILWFIDQYPYHPRNWIVYRFELFCGCIENLRDFHFYSVSGGGKSMLSNKQ